MPVWRSAFLVLLLAAPGFALAEEGTDERSLEERLEDEEAGADEPPMDGEEELDTENYKSLNPEQRQFLHAKMDADANGKLSLDEVIESFYHTRRLAAAKYGKSIMESVDVDKDGKVSLDEVAKYMSGTGNESDVNEEVTAALDEDKTLDVKRFKMADGNSDGLLDEFELGVFFNPDTHDDLLHFMAQSTMSERDHDKDGLLTFKEFHIQDSEEDMPEEGEESEQIFKKLDKDGNGQLDVKELLLYESGHMPTVDAMEKFMQLADTDGDQHVTVDEFHDAHRTEDEACFHFIEMAEHFEL